MTSLRCDDCGDNFEAPSLDAVTKHPGTGEALCPECSKVECVHCGHPLDVAELTSNHVHESDGFVCDTCPRVEFPYEFTMTFKREPEGYIPSYMSEVFPDVRLSDDYNADGIPRTWWRWRVHVTYRVTSPSEMEVVAVNGKRLDGEDDG